MAGKKGQKYGDAVEELERIIAEIEGEGVDVDVLTDKVKRATELIALCKEKLKSTEVEVKKALEGLEAEGQGGEPAGDEEEESDTEGPDALF